MANKLQESALVAKLSRRACLPLLAAITLSPAVAWAQGDAWQMFRREDLGFEIEMPGQPKIEVEESKDKNDPALKSVNASFDFEDTLFGAHFEEYRQPVSIQQEVAAQRMAARGMQSKIISETAFTMDGFPGVVIVSDGIGGKGFSVIKIVVMQNRRIFVSAIGPQGGKDSPAVRRFLDSFKLLSVRR